MSETSKRRILRHPNMLKFFAVLGLLLTAWVIYLDAQVRFKFEGKRWALPAQVYARTLEIYNDRALNLNNLKIELKMLGYTQTASVKQPRTYSIDASRAGTYVEIYVPHHQTPEGTQEAAHFGFRIEQDIVKALSTHNGQPQALYTLEALKIGGIYPRTKEERILLPYHQIPENLVATLLLTEDRNFKHHIGIAPLSIARAAIANLKAGRVVQGGSTLTQQLVKNFYLSRERSLSRKLNEALMSLLLEAHYDKQSILETYMNDVFLGQSGELAIHGFAAASLFYFGKDLANCTIAEHALLVAMIKGPTYYNPRRFPERATQRRNMILALLNSHDLLDDHAYQQAKNQPLTLVERPTLQTNPYPAFMDLLRRQLAKDYHEEDLRTEGLRIYTTLDPQIQSQLEQASTTMMAKLDGANTEQTLQIGAVVSATGTGEVLAIIGDRRARYRGFNRALDAVRPIGSLIKPATYLSALEQPERYHLASLLSDEAFRIEFEDGQTWAPENFDKKSHGSVPLYLALAKSYNLSSARLGLDLGIDSVHSTLENLGVTRDLNPYPSLFLGSQALSPFEVTQAYQTIASNGFNIPLRAIREVTDKQQQTLSRYPVEIKQVVSPQATYLLQHALVQTMQTGTGRSVYQHLPKALIVAGKTGTTNNNRDSWFTGFSGDYLATIWLGRDDNQPTRLTGSSGALKVWSEFIKRIPQYPLNMDPPAGIEYYWFNADKGTLTDEHCQSATYLPAWGRPESAEYEACSTGYSSVKGWIKSWF
jgi:penicillin-binding protein 1B